MSIKISRFKYEQVKKSSGQKMIFGKMKKLETLQEVISSFLISF